MARRIGSKRQLAPLHAQFHAPVNSDFHPVVQLEATRARFARRSAQAIVELANSALPANEMLGGLPMGTLSADHASGGTERVWQLQAALDLHGVLARGRYPAQRLAPAAALALKQPGALCGRQVSDAMLEQLHAAALQTLSHLAPPARRELWTEPRWLGCPLPRAGQAVRDRFAVYGAIAARDAQAMHRRAAALLADERTAQEAWGRYWGWDPKETWSFITWVVFAGYLHARATTGWKGRRAAVIALVGFGSLLITYYAVNLWIAGLHSYAT